MRHASLLVPFVVLLAAPGLRAQVKWWEGDMPGAITAAADAPAKLVLLYCWHDPHPACSSMFAGTMSDEIDTGTPGRTWWAISRIFCSWTPLV